MATIDNINYGGVNYEFVDSTARSANVTLANRVSSLNTAQTEALSAETERAVNAEAALEAAKVSKVSGKDLSTNDFTDAYKALLDDPIVMTGATSSKAGANGVVPAPAAGDQEKYLRGDGAWEVPTDTTYEEVTQTVAGLMSAADKVKLDNIDTATDDMSSDHIVFNSDGSISETLGNGKSKKTVFNSDGSITQTIINSAGTKTVLTTTFNSDGSIDRTVT